MNEVPSAALFDWDGTLVDSPAAIYRANTKALATIGITMDRTWFRERYTPDWCRSYAELGVPEDMYDELAERWAREMEQLRPRALPWVRGGLRRLWRHGVRLGIVTASMRSVIQPGMARLNLEGLFEVVVCADDVERGKPLRRRVGRDARKPACTPRPGHPGTSAQAGFFSFRRRMR